MRTVPVILSLALGCSGCVATPPEPAFTQVTITTPANSPNCRDYTAIATIDGVPQQIAGHACQLPDGTWQIGEGPPGQPDQYVAVYSPPPYAYYAADDPWLWGPPVGLSIGGFIFIDVHHHLHDGHRFAHLVAVHRNHGFAHRMGGMRHG